VSTDEIHLPALLPLLSRGKHRSPRKGACFMEFASVLAGERWSDHPTCTHPLLAAVARQVNDHTSDAGRQRLAGLIPAVIGLTSDDLQVDARIALRCATTALPVASADRQRVLAVGVLTADRMLAGLDRRPPGRLEEHSARALADVPDAARWAERFASELGVSAKAFRHRSAPSIISCAIPGIALACVPDPDAILRDLLIGAIDDCATWVRRDADPVPSAFAGRPAPEPDRERDPAMVSVPSVRLRPGTGRRRGRGCGPGRRSRSPCSVPSPGSPGSGHGRSGPGHQRGRGRSAPAGRGRAAGRTG
jgi:hypothetical protein